MAMWRPPQRIRHTPQPGRWPTAEQAQSARLFSPTQIGPLALQACRETLRNDLIPAFRAATEREAFQQAWLRETDDFKEGVRASDERRPARFTGR